MKANSRLGYAVLFFVSQASFAAVPVSMTGPSPAVASSYAVGSSTTLTYTITNRVPQHRFPITVSGISGLITRTTVSNDCGSALPTGPSTCNIGVAIAPTSDNAGQSINQTLTINYQGRIPLTSVIASSVPSSPPGSLARLIAVGENYDGTQPPLLVQSTNGGTAWSLPSVTGALTDYGGFFGGSCTGSSTTAICVAAGQDFNGTFPPIIAVTIDGGSSWANKTIAGPITTNGYFLSASCTDVEASAICAAGGVDDAASTPLLAVSTDGGNSWSGKSISGVLTNRYFKSVSCTGSGSNAVCAAVGGKSAGPSLTLAVSQDGANTWALVPLATPVAGELLSASCVGNGATATCLAGGQGISDLYPLLKLSTDGGTTWNSQTISGAPPSGIIYAVSCTGDTGAPICIGVGRDNTSPNPPMIVATTNGGTTWINKTIAGTPTSGILEAASCTGTGSSAICVASGFDNTGTFPPLLVVSTDGANTWAVKTVPGMPATGDLPAVSCTGSGSTAICTAAGVDDGAGTPLLLVSIDGANTWAVQSVSGIPSQGKYYGTGASSSDTGFAELSNHKDFGMEKILRHSLHL